MTQPRDAVRPRESIGKRIRRWRSIADMTQQQLADGMTAYLQLDDPLTGSFVSMIENGHRPVERRPVLLAFAHVLRVSVTDLVGQPYPPTVGTDLDLYVAVPAIRAALDEPDDPVAARTLDALGAATDQAMAARMACDYATLGRVLPGVLAETRLLWRQNQPDHTAGELLVRAAVTGALALKPAGFLDLAIRLAELGDRTARQLDDPVCVAAADYTTAQCALAAGNRRRSLTVAADAAGRISDLTGPAERDGLAWGTMLHLHAALSAASLHRGGDAAGHLAAARDLASRVRRDSWLMEAHPDNVATWEVGIALENGEPERAPTLAGQVDVTKLRTRQRRARLHMDTGRGLFLVGNFDAAVRSFLAADQEAPGDLRHRPSAVELVGQMVRDAPVRGGSSALRDLAVRVGVDPFAPTEAA